MASGFNPSLLLPRGIRNSTNSMILNPESDVMPPSPRRRSRAGSIVRKRLSSVSSKLGKKKRTPPPPEEAPPEQAPARAMSITVRPKVKKSPLLQWMERECPQDVVPKILAFCGPQTTAALFQCNRFWHQLISSERTWRVLCEELYKVCVLAIVRACILWPIAAPLTIFPFLLHYYKSTVERRRRGASLRLERALPLESLCSHRLHQH